MIINLDRKQIQHLLSVLESDRFHTIDCNDVSEAEFWENADQSVQDYVKRTDAIYQYLEQQLSMVR